MTKVRFLVDRLDKAKEALNTAKIRFSEEEVITLNLDNRPGALAEVAEKLAQSKINIRYAYAAAAEDSAKATLIVVVPNVNKALGVLGE
jgi:hypothetical protein